MKRLIFSCLGVVWMFLSSAQSKPDNTVVLDLAEDTTQVTTINDIIEVQEVITSRNYNTTHFSKVWSNNSFLNLDYNLTAHLSPQKTTGLIQSNPNDPTQKNEINTGYTGYNDGKVPEFKSDWGVSLQLGRNYRLHKAPIANILQFNIDYSYIDLNVNHYKAEKAEFLYNSAEKHDREFLYIPWCLEKYEVNYGMTVGPSITVAPFIFMDIPQLHYLKFNVYFHIGYHASLLWIQNDEDKDANPRKETTDNEDVNNFYKMNNTLKLNLGHGLIYSFGCNLSWKSIGLGYELRTGDLDYMSLNKNVFGSQKYKFQTLTSRLYLQIRY